MSNKQAFRQVGVRQRSVRAKFMRATELVFVLAMGSTLVVTVPAASYAQDLTWNGAGDVAWDNTSNWTEGTTPTGTSDVLLDTPAVNQPIVVGSTAAGTLTVNTITVDQGQLLLRADGSGSPTLTVTNGTIINGGTVAVNDASVLDSTVNVGVNGMLNVDGSVTGLVTTSGSVTNSGNLAGGLTVAGGTASNSGTVGGTLTVTGTGTFLATADTTIGAIALGPGATLLAATGTTLEQLGTVSANNGGTLTFGSATDTGTISFVPTGGSFAGNLGYVVAGGTLQPASTNAAFMLANIASTTVEDGATLDIGLVDTTVNGLSGAGVVTNSGATDRVLGVTGTSTFSGVIADGPTNTISLVRSETGATTLGGANTYTGATTVNGGALVLDATGSILNTSGITVGTDGTLDAGGSGNALANTVVINNSGTFTLTGSDETIGSVFGSGDINLNDNTLTTGDATDAEISGIISGTGGLVKQGSGTLTVSGTNTYSGGTAINDGTLTTNNESALGTGTVTVNGGTLDLDANLSTGALAGAGDVTLDANRLTIGGNDASATHSGVISGSGGLTKTGTGEQILTGTNTFTGELVVGQGTLTAGSAGAFGAGPNMRVNGIADLGGFTITKNSLIVQNGTTQNGTFSLTNDAQFQNATINTVLSGVGGVRSVGNGTSTLSAANTFTGDISAHRGTLNITGSTVSETVNITDLNNNGAGVIVNGNSLADTAAVTISNSGVLTVAGDETIGSLSSTSATASVLMNATLTTGDAGTDTFAGVLSGAGDFVYQGSGEMTLSGINTLTGDIRNTGGGAMTLSGSTAGDVVNTLGAFTNSGTISGDVSNANSFTNAGTISGNVTNSSSFINTDTVAGDLTNDAGTVNNSGAINGTLTNGAASIFNALTGGTYGGDIDNEAQFNIGANSFAMDGVFTNNGTVTNTSGGVVAFTVGTGTNFINDGTLNGGTGPSQIVFAGDTFTIESGSSVIGNVILDVNELIANADYDLSGTTTYNLTNNATATVVADADFSGGDLTNTDIVDVSGGNLVDVGELNNTGTINIGDGAGTARTLEASSITNDGTININDGSTLRGTGNTTNNTGLVNVAGGGSLIETTGDYNNLASGEVNFNDAAAKSFDVQAGIITNAGDLNFNAGTTTVNSVGGAIENNTGGTITIADGATMDASGDTMTNIGTVAMAGPTSALTIDTLTNDTGGVVNAQGTLTGAVINQGSGDFNIVGSLTGVTDVTNTDTATFDVDGSTSSTIGSLTNTTTAGTGTTIASFGTLNVTGAIENGLADGSAASLITNNWNLLGSSTITNHAGATLNSNTTVSALSATDLTNNGTMNVQGQLQAATITNSGAAATFNVIGDTYGGGAPSGASPSPTPTGTFLNADSATLNISGGAFEVSTFTNTSGGTGTTLGTAGVQVQADGILDADTVANNGTGTINNAGTIQATTITNGDSGNAATLTNTGTLTSSATAGMGMANAAGSTLVSTGTIDASASADAAAFLNAGVADVEGTIIGNVTNTGDFEATNDLAHTGTFTNDVTGTVTVTAGTMDTSGNFFNNGTGTGATVADAGVRVAAGAELEALNIINNADGTMAVAGTLDSLSGAINAIGNIGTMTVDNTGVALGGINTTGTLTSTGQLNEGLTNAGDASISNQVLGAIQNNAGGQLDIDGNLTMNSTLDNVAGGQVDLNAGTITGLTSLTNSGFGTGTGVGTAGFEIDAGATANASDVLNTGIGTTFVAGTLNSGSLILNGAGATLTSTGALSGGLSNSGAAIVSGQLSGLVENGARGQLTIDGDLVMDNVLNNLAFGEVDVDAGTVTGLTTLTNLGQGTGTGVGAAGFEIDLGAAVNATNVSNTGTMFVAGGLNSTNFISNAPGATLTSTGEISGGLINSGTATVSNQLLGGIQNSSGAQLTVDGDLILDNFLNNLSGGLVDVDAGTVTGLTSLTNVGAGTGTGAGTAGFEIDLGATVNTTNLLNTGNGTMFVAGTLNAANGVINFATATFTSIGNVSSGLLNSGTATLSNELLGVVQNSSGGQLSINGDLTMNNSLTNDAGGLVDVDAGIVTGLTTLSNASDGSGTGAGTAGFEIDAGAAVNAADVSNTGTMYIAGTLNSANSVDNSGTLTSIGAVSGGLNNTNDVFMEGVLDGDVLNEGGSFTVTGDLSGTGGGASGNFVNSDIAVLSLTAGSTFSLDTLDNDTSSLVELNDGTIDGAVNNEGTIVQSGAITGAFVNDGLVDMADAETGDVVSAQGGLTSTGTYDYDLDLSLDTPGADLFEVTGATTGTLDLQFETSAGDAHLLADALVVFDVDEAATNDFTFTATGLDIDGSPVSVFTIQDAPNGDISVQTGVSLSLGALLEGVGQVEGLASLQAGSLAAHVTNCGGAGGWGRVTGGEATTSASTANVGQEGALDINTDYQGVQAGANLGCTTTAGGWDVTYSALAGVNSGSSAQDLNRDGTDVGTTGLDFEQVYAGFYGTTTNGQVTADLMVSYGQTDYDVQEGEVDLGLTDTAFSTQTVSFAGSVSYDYALNDRGLSVVPRAGFSLASTGMDDLTFEPGQTLQTDDFTTTTGFAGAMLNYANTSDGGQTVLSTFAGATYYSMLSTEQAATLVETNGIEGELSTSGVDGFGELSVGIDFSRALDSDRTFNASLRADSRFADDIEGYNVALEVGLRF